MQKRLLALVATVAMVLSMFAGIAFAAPADTSRISGTHVVSKIGSEGKLEAIVAIDPTTVDSVENPEGTSAKWFKGLDLDQPASGYTLSKVVRGGRNLEIHEDGSDTQLTCWLDAKDDPYKNEYTITWSHDTDDTKDDIVETLVINYEPTNRKITLGSEKVISSFPRTDYQLISGSFPAGDLDYVVEVYHQNGTTGIYTGNDAIEATGGSFSFYLDTNLLPEDVKLIAKIGNTEVATGKVEVRYNVVTSPEKLEFDYTGEQNPVAITGTVTNSKGEPVEGVVVQLNNGKAAPALNEYFGTGATTNAKGEFGHVVLRWKAAEKLNLTLAGTAPDNFTAIKHAEATIKAKAASLTVKPNSGVVHTVAPVEFEVKGADYPAGKTVTFELKKGTANAAGFTPPAVTVGTDGTFTAKFTWKPTSSGTYKLTAKADNHSATADISVTNPVSYNLINGSKLEELKVGSNVFDFGTGNEQIHLIQYKASGATENKFYYTVTVDGKVVKDTSTDKDFVKLETGRIDISTTKLGTKTIKVQAYETDDTNAKVVFERTITAKVVGWDVALEPTELTVNETKDVVVVVKDENGAPINNAKVEIVGVKTLEAGSSNVQNGTYTLKDIKVATPGTKVVKVYKGTQVMAELKLEVVGQKVYNVTADVDALLQGKAQDVKFTVTRDGVAVIPQRIKVIYEDGTSEQVLPAYQGEGVSKAEIKATKAGEVIFRVENFNGTLCGETTINVVAPQLVLIDEEAVDVTENFKSKVHFKVIDPRDDSVIKANLAISAKYADIEVYDANDGIIVAGTDDVVQVLGDEEYALAILATNADYDQAEDDEKVVAVVVKVNGAELDAHFEIKEATISSDPGMIVIGANNNLTITLADANGLPIAGKQLYAGDTKVAKTNEDGEVIYPVSVATGDVVIKADTDATYTDDNNKEQVVKIEHTIKVGYDTEAPKVDYELDGNKATLVITDNVRLVRINIAGKEIDFWPGAKYVHNVTLKPGVNKFAVKAQDSNDNVLDEVVEIEYKTDSVVLKDAEVKRQGEFVFVQLRQFEEIGAQVGWKQATRTATFIVGDTKVEVTIGSTTAMVNGKTVTMPAAPFIANDRTYVPTRFIAEALGWNVHWAVGDIITITLP